MKNLCTKCKKPYISPLATFKLYTDGKKVWMTDICSKCELKIIQENNELKQLYPHKVFKE